MGDNNKNFIDIYRPAYNDEGQEEHKRHGKAKKGGSVKSVIAAFTAGAMVVGGLMFASDKMNLFTGAGQAMASSVSTAANSSGNGSVTTASMDMNRPNNISDIVKQAEPAVVKIETKVKQQTRRSGNSSYWQFFGNNGSEQSQGQDGSLQSAGIGSGFIFESSGYILTNEHVVNGAAEIEVTVQGYDKPFKAALLGSSYDLDLAVLKIEGNAAFPTLPIGNSDDAQVGDWLVAIGNPYDFDYTVTAGLLSAKDRPIDISDEQGTRNYKHLLQTDAAINPGNSGGPLLNLKGEVIGINTAVNAEAQGIGFAIPSSTISSVLNDLKNNVTIPKEPAPYIGVSIQNITEDMLGDLKLGSTDGVVVADVTRKSPAFEAGIRPYDVIIAANGAKISSTDEFTKLIQSSKVGDQVTLTIIRDGNKQDRTVAVGNKNETNSSQQ